MAELLSKVLGGSVDPGAVVGLAARSQGNLPFLRQLVLGAVQSGALVNDAGLWHLVAPLAPSQRLVELVEARLRDLDPVERTLLEAVAVGEPLGMAEVTALGDPVRAESLEAQGLLAVRADGRRLDFRLGHPLYGEVLRGSASTLRRRAVVRVLAESVEAAGARRAGDDIRVVTWRLDAGGAAPDRLLAAAEAEMAALVGSDDDERARLAVVRLDNLRFLGRVEEAKTPAWAWGHRPPPPSSTCPRREVSWCFT